MNLSQQLYQSGCSKQAEKGEVKEVKLKDERSDHDQHKIPSSLQASTYRVDNTSNDSDEVKHIPGVLHVVFDPVPKHLQDAFGREEDGECDIDIR